MNNTKKEFKSISNFRLNELGINLDNPIVETIDELKKFPPTLVIAECVKTFKFNQNKYFNQELSEKNQYFNQELIKKNKYIMGLGVYYQLHSDPSIKKRNYFLRPAAAKFKNMYRPYSGEDLTDKTLLIWRTGGIGDLLFIQPNLVYLKNKYPTVKFYLHVDHNIKVWLELGIVLMK